MPYRLDVVCERLETLWPQSGAEAWDALGLTSGDPHAMISRILLTVDTVRATVDEAVDAGADLIVSHHPLLLRGVTSVAENHYKGGLIATLIRHNCALLAAHTNADVVSDGTSAVLARRLGLRDIVPLSPSGDTDTGIGRVGDLEEPRSLGSLARTVADILPPTASGVRVAGDFDQPVARVALCGGAGDSLLNSPAVRSSDVYITADLRHHPASEARDEALAHGGPALIDVSHWASEWLWLDVAADNLRTVLPDVTVLVSDIRTDPWDFVLLQ